MALETFRSRGFRLDGIRKSLDGILGGDQNSIKEKVAPEWRPGVPSSDFQFRDDPGAGLVRFRVCQFFSTPESRPGIPEFRPEKKGLGSKKYRLFPEGALPERLRFFLKTEKLF